METLCILNDNNLKKISYEFTAESLIKTIEDLQKQLSNLFRKIITLIKQSIQHTPELQDLERSRNELLDKKVREIQELEQEYIDTKEYILKMIEISQADLKHSKVEIEFENENEKQEFINNIEDRYSKLQQYQKNLEQLERLNDIIRCGIEKFSVSNGIILDQSFDKY